ncbi:MAG: hypothetical protein R3F59_10595 [Myxococcota bacterium]
MGWERGLRRPVIVGFAQAAVAPRADAPSQDLRDDVHAVGTLLHQMLFGAVPDAVHPPVTGEWRETLRALVARCVSPDRSERPESGGVLARELAQALED